MKVSSFAALAALGLAGCAGMSAEQTVLVPLTDEIREEAAAGIRKQLKDPDSAKFDGMIASRSVKSGIVNVCGTVNAKNSYGGYNGPVRFIAKVNDGAGNPKVIPLFADGAVAGPGPNGDFGINMLCRQVGL